MPTLWDTVPRSGIDAERVRRGRAEVVTGCVDLLAGREVEDVLILALAGPAAEQVFAGREGGRGGG